MSRKITSLKGMEEEGLLYLNLVIPSDNEKFKNIRLQRKRQDGGQFTQADCARLLSLTDDSLISKYENKECNIDNRTYSYFLLATDNHPKYSLFKKSKDVKEDKLLIKAPSNPIDIKKTRMNIKGLQQNQSSYLVGLHKKMFGRYESTTASDDNKRSPTDHTWTLYLLATKQHPFYELKAKT